MFGIRMGEATAQTIAQTMRKEAEDNIGAIRESLKSLDHNVQELEKRVVQEEAEAEKLRVRYEKTAQVCEQSLRRYRKIELKRDAARALWQDKSRAASRTYTDINSGKHSATMLDRQISGLAEQLENEAALNAQAEMLMGMSGFIDATVPIHIDPTVPSITWRTRDIRIKDGFGGELPQSFGQYDVSVTRLTANSGVSRVEVVCALIPGSRSDTDNLHYPHPHISGTNPCLGNALDLLGAAMGTLDFVKIVVVMTEFLTSYNHENPYIKLRDLGIPNRWEHAVCESEQHLMSDCGCNRCPTCGHIKPLDAPKSECGSCMSCCVRHHLHDPVAEEQKAGINGTGCTHRAVPRHLYRVHVQTNQGAANESDGQENAHVHQDGVGQDVGHDPAVQG